MKNLLATLSLILFCLISITSCKTNFYQVYTVETDGAKQVDNSLVFENEECKVYYNLWSNNGKISFYIYNKTDKDIFIDLAQTFFINNDCAVEYFQDRTFGEQSLYQTSIYSGTANIISRGSGLWSNNIYRESSSTIINEKSVKNLTLRAHSVTQKEKKIICIPNKCYRFFSYYNVDPARIVTCNDKQDYPSKKANVGEYDKKNSPSVFTNRIAYSFNKDITDEKYMDNTFWVSSIMNYSQNEATEKVYDEDICGKKKSGSGYGGLTVNPKKVRLFKIGGPNKFYKFYKSKGM